MFGENMIMAFHAIRANKMRSFLTMLGIIIGIGSVISIVSIGDTMRSLFSDLYKDAGATQAVVSIGYNVEDVRDSDYFTLDELDKIREVRAMLNEKNLETDIQVDGGIYVENVREVLDAGANVIVAGSAVFRGDAGENTAKFMEILKSYE